ncbi:MAG: carboxypeptidase-like regulatory domain-containing protein [Vicinamibacterales bacterium]
MMRALLLVLLALSPLQQQRRIAAGPPPAPGTAAIGGRVLGSDGRPIARADVRLAPTARTAPMFTTTDEEGHYQFTGVAAGDYRMLVLKGGYGTAAYGERHPGGSGALITVHDGQTLDDIDVTLMKYRAIVGHVYDENGDPVEGASVRASTIQFVNGRREIVDADARLTDDRGQFRVYGLQPGGYVVSALVGQIEPGPGMADMPGYAATYYPGSTNASDAQLVAVGASSDATGIDFRLMPAPTAHVAGHAFHASGDPVTGGLEMRSSQRSGSVAIDVGAIINDGGEFIFPNVAPGEYVIQAFGSRVNASTEGEFASQFVEVNGADVNDVSLRTTAGSTVTGRITLDGDATIAPHDVELAPEPADTDRAPFSDGAIAHLEIHDDWTFTVAGLHGPRLFRLTSAPPGWMLKAVYINGVDATDQPQMFGTDSQSSNRVEIVLTPNGAEITGTVVDDRNALVSEANVIVFPADSTQWSTTSRFMKTASVARDGTFDIAALPAGDYYVAAVDHIAGDEWQDPALLDRLSSKAVRIFADEGQKTPVTLTLVSR